MKYLDVLTALSPAYRRELDSLTVVTAAYLLERKLYEANAAERAAERRYAARRQPMS